MKKILVIFIIGIVIYEWTYDIYNPSVLSSSQSISIAKNDNDQINQELDNTILKNSNSILQSAFNNRLSDLQVEGSGIVIKLLPDDNISSRHQKFILQLSSRQTLLVAHNIDLAPRINTLSNGDKVEFYGEYEWNQKGGVIHWTHGDPNGYHVGGWLKHNGRIYQ